MRIVALLSLYFIYISITEAQQLYYPPVNNNLPWDTISPVSLGWCPNKIDSLYQYLGQQDSKAFLVLKDGKIVLEKYFGSFTQDSIWYWASAGKTLTAFLVGRAQEEGDLAISDTTSRFLGNGWTVCPPTKEEKITIRHQLTMTSGLDDGVPDNHCTIDTCLQYLADAGTRWAYHNAPYTLLESVLENATGTPINTYTYNKLMAPTGIAGLWVTVDYDNVFFSRARSMARFGILIQGHGIWNGDTLLHDALYYNSMLNTSQSLNNSYGYLWWLNGKASFMLPGLQLVFPGSWAPHAPADMVAALGKNGQILSISPSKGIVMVRMGNAPTGPGSEVPYMLCDKIWEKLIAAMCQPSGIAEHPEIQLSIFPQPGKDIINIESSLPMWSVEITDLTGRVIEKEVAQGTSKRLNIAAIAPGAYIIRIQCISGAVVSRKILVQK